MPPHPYPPPRTPPPLRRFSSSHPSIFSFHFLCPQMPVLSLTCMIYLSIYVLVVPTGTLGLEDESCLFIAHLHILSCPLLHPDVEFQRGGVNTSFFPLAHVFLTFTLCSFMWRPHIPSRHHLERSISFPSSLILFNMFLLLMKTNIPLLSLFTCSYVHTQTIPLIFSCSSANMQSSGSHCVISRQLLPTFAQ